MPTELPEKRISKIQVDANNTYDIIPESLQNNGYQATLPTLEEDSTIALEGQVITVVEDTEDIPDNIRGLYRTTEETDIGEQSSHIIEVIKKDYDASEVLFEKTTETNNTSLTESTFFDHFASTLPGWLTISSVSSIYTLYYNLPFNGIRFGAGSSAGSFTFTISADCNIEFYKYFSYNGSTHEIISYDAAAKVIVDGVDYTFVDDTTPVVVSLSAGTHTISSYYGGDSSSRGRIILTSFEFSGDPYTAYEQKELARVEDVEEVNTDLQQHKTESHNRFVTDEQAINTNRQGIVDINSRMGDIQLFQSQYANLPNASAEYKDKIYRDKYSDALYQCISIGSGASKDWDFANVSGTSEITSSNVSSFYGDAGSQFSNYFNVNDFGGATIKFYRNGGSLKLGSSSAVGAVEFTAVSDGANLPISALTFGVKAYNANGSTVQYEAEFYNANSGNYQYVDGTIFISNNDTETLIDLTDNIPSGWTLSYLDISSVAQHNTAGEEEEPVMVNNDKRLIITRLIANFGAISYQWVPAGVPEIVFTNTLKIKNLPLGGSYLYWPDEGNGYLVRKYYDGSYTELYFQTPEEYGYYEGSNIENTSVMTAYDNADWYTYAIDSNVVHKSGSENISGTKTFNGQIVANGQLTSNGQLVSNGAATFNNSVAVDIEGSNKEFKILVDTSEGNNSTFLKVDDENIGVISSFETETLTAARTYTFPDKSGVIALQGPSKTYTGLIGTSNNWIGCNFFFINVKPTSWQAEWTVRYRLECELDSGLSPTNGQYMHSTHECFVGGSRGLFNTFSNFNSINNTSYRVIGYGILAKTTETGFNNNCGHMLGISLYYDGLAYQNQNVNYKRTIKVTVLEAVNCTATLENAPLISHNATRTDYTKLDATYYPYSSSESNTAGYLSTMDVYTQGLRETGDDNNTDLLYYHNQWTPISSNLGLAGYSLFGFNPAGEIMSISIADPSNPYQSEAVTTNRSYNAGGFDWARGLYRWTSGGYWAPSTTNLTHAYKVLTFNFKQTDNLVNAAGTNLTMIANKFVYLRGTIGSDGLFYLAPIEVSYNSATYKRAWTQDIPSSEDGYVYWLVGHAYSGGSATVNLQDVRLYAENPLFWYKDGKFREYDPGYTGVKRYI